MDKSSLTAPPESVLMLEDSRQLTRLLRESAPAPFLFETLPPTSFRTMRQLRDALRARRMRAEGGYGLRSNGGGTFKVIGIDANLMVPRGAGGGRRELCLGLSLLEWMRTNLLLTTPVVLWSFLSAEALDGAGPSVMNDGRVVKHLHLPASAVEFGAAFASTAEAGSLISLHGPEPAIAPPRYGDGGSAAQPTQRAGAPFSEDAWRAVSEILKAYGEIGGELARAVRALKDGDAERLSVLLAGGGWREFFELAKGLQRRLAQGGEGLDAPVQIARRSVWIQSFRTWFENNRGAGRADLAGVADFYLQSSAALDDSLEVLRAQFGGDAKG